MHLRFISYLHNYILTFSIFSHELFDNTGLIAYIICYVNYIIQSLYLNVANTPVYLITHFTDHFDSIRVAFNCLSLQGLYGVRYTFRLGVTLPRRHTGTEWVWFQTCPRVTRWSAPSKRLCSVLITKGLSCLLFTAEP